MLKTKMFINLSIDTIRIFLCFFELCCHVYCFYYGNTIFFIVKYNLYLDILNGILLNIDNESIFHRIYLFAHILFVNSSAVEKLFLIKNNNNLFFLWYLFIFMEICLMLHFILFRAKTVKFKNKMIIGMNCILIFKLLFEWSKQHNRKLIDMDTYITEREIVELFL